MEFVKWNGRNTSLWIAKTRNEYDPFALFAHSFELGYFIVEEFETRQQAERYLEKFLNELNAEDES